MSSSSSDENETTIHRTGSNTGGSGIYSQPRAGSSKRTSNVRHDVSDVDDEEEHYARFREDTVRIVGKNRFSMLVKGQVLTF